jgi:DNA invertase Pin-like site-specific DNA recombinase
VSKLYVTYFIAQQPQKVGHRLERSAGNVRSLFPVSDGDRISEAQRQVVNDYIDSQEAAEVLETFIEIPESKKNNKWPQLEKAIDYAKAKNATLVVAELGALTNNETFSQLLLDSGIAFHFCDQPYVDRKILEGLHKHAQVLRKLHGKLIKEGLKHTSAKSGNPNAAEVISKVNKPKIDVAIVFADLLQPIIADYKRKGYSQRQMVKALNEEGFTAPEGGKWVLSQLQKVLDRVRLNEVARDLRNTVEPLRANALSDAGIAEELNTKGISSLKRTTWDEAQVKKLLARLDQIKDIELINKFVLDLLPLLHAYRSRGLSAIEMLQEFEAAGLPIRQQATEAVA